MKIIYYKHDGSKTEDINEATKAEQVSLSAEGTVSKVEYYVKLPQKLRNTYQVPAGQQVTVDTPQGEKKYTGGQYVPPEQLANARTSTASGGGENKKGQPPAQAGPGWPEIVEQFKKTDISDPKKINQASYNIRQFLPIPIIPETKVAPICKFGAELSLANIMNSYPGTQGILAGVKIILSSTPPPPQVANFKLLGYIDQEKQEIKYYEYNTKPQFILHAVSNFISDKVGLYIIYGLSSLSSQTKNMVTKLDNMIASLQPKIKEDKDNAKEIIQQVQEMQKLKESTQALPPLLASLTDATASEGGLNIYIDEQKEKLDPQFSKVISHANVFSLGARQTFDKGMEDLASTHPDTLVAVKKILEWLNQRQSQ